MANLKEIRNRIVSVSSTMQITSAMKMVSAAKLKKAQDAITAMRPYSQKLTELLQNLSSALNDEVGGEYTSQRPINKVLVVAITSNRGLCGAFNTNIIKQVKQIADNKYANQHVDIITVGKKGNDILSKTYNVVSNKSSIYDDLTFANVAEFAESLMQKFVSGEYDKIELVYNHFRNAASQDVLIEDYLPLKPIEGSVSTSADYIFEPSKKEIVVTLIPKTLKIQLYKAIRDSFASEHGARMTAMHKATDNATDLRNQLKLTYNKARQAAITNEILEIVGGAEALKS